LAKLLVRAGSNPGQEHGLPDGGEVRIGRQPGLGITLLDTKVSREHCRLFLQATGWVVEDLGSRNGTYVNSQKVKKRLLQPGDRLRVGQTEFEFSTAAAGAPEATQGDAPPGKGPAFPALKSTRRPPA
jgi:pSer/pThr/pTyr-binding forkhead associated (FHA) protein